MNASTSSPYEKMWHPDTRVKASLRYAPALRGLDPDAVAPDHSWVWRKGGECCARFVARGVVVEPLQAPGLLFQVAKPDPHGAQAFARRGLRSDPLT